MRSFKVLTGKKCRKGQSRSFWVRLGQISNITKSSQVITQIEALDVSFSENADFEVNYDQ